jgi:hypothetical protein
MAQRLLIHPNERLDIDDVNSASYGYTDDVSRIFNKLLASSDALSVVRPFRIAIEDQTVPSNYGKITVYGGSYLDRAGNLVYGFSSGSAFAQSITLTGSSQTFYLEVQLEVVSTALDARAFFDPTFDNGTDFPGKEFLATVPTQEQVRWSLVTPVSTTGFSLSTSSTSIKLPIARLSTNSSGQILPAVNPGLVLEQYKTSTLKAAPSGTNTLYVSNVGPIVAGNVLTLTSVDMSTSISVTVQSVNSFEGTISLTGALGSTFAAGASIVVSGAAKFLQLRITPDANLTGVSTHPDKQVRLFCGNESLGLVDNNMFAILGGVRSDSAVDSIKKLVDFLAAQLFELKYGVVSPAPAVTTLEGKRYFDAVGSIVGVKTFTSSIGNGVSTFGDFNGGFDTTFQSALDACAGFGASTSVVLYVKPGEYEFGATVIVPPNISSLTIVGQEGGEGVSNNKSVSLRLGTSTTNAFSFSNGTNFTFKNLTLDLLNTVADSVFVQTGLVCTASLEKCTITTLLTGGSATRRVFSGTGVLIIRASDVLIDTAMCLQLGRAPTLIPQLERVNGTIQGAFLVESTGFAANSTKVNSGFIKDCNLTIEHNVISGGLYKSDRISGSFSSVEITGNTIVQGSAGLFGSLGESVIDIDGSVNSVLLAFNSVSCRDVGHAVKILPANIAVIKDNKFDNSLNAVMNFAGVVSIGGASVILQGNTLTLTSSVPASSSLATTLVEPPLGTIDDLVITDNVLRCNTAALECYLLFLENTQYKSVSITKNRGFGGNALVHMGDTTYSKGAVVVSDNDYNSNGSSITAVVTQTALINVGLGDSPASGGQSVLISNNNIRNSKPATSVYGIRVANGDTGALSGTNSVVIKDNNYNCGINCSTLGITAPVYLAGIYCTDLNASVFTGSTVVENNVIINAGVTDSYAGIYVDNKYQNQQIVRGNSVSSIALQASLTIGSTAGIFVGGSAVVSHNHISLLQNNNNDPVYGIVGSGTSTVANRLIVDSNLIHDIASTTSQESCGIRALDMTGVVVSNNVLETTGNGITLSGNSASSAALRFDTVVSGNSIKGATRVGIRVSHGGSSSVTSKQITGNSISNFGGSDNGLQAFLLTGLKNVTFTGNCVLETSSNATASGFGVGLVVSGCSGVSISGNTFTGSATPSGPTSNYLNRCAIGITNSQEITISGNTLRWQRSDPTTNAALNFGDAEIFASNSTGIVVSGNSHIGHATNIGGNVHPLVAATGCTGVFASSNFRQGFGVWILDLGSNTAMAGAGQIAALGIYSNYATVQ